MDTKPGKTPNADELALAQMQELVALAKVIATERESEGARDQHPVSNLHLRATDKGFNGRDFLRAWEAALAAGLLEHTPACGPKNFGVFKVAVKA